MDHSSASDIFKILKDDNLSFAYKGNFTDDITEKVISLSDQNIDNNAEKLSKMRKKVSFLMAECFQNVIRHSEDEGQSLVIDNLETDAGLFMTRNIGGTYYIISANHINNDKIEPLKETLLKVNTLDKEGLKKLYMEVLNDGELSDKGGAGLGLIEMARKSGHPLDFDFVQLDENKSFFYFLIKLKSPLADEAETEHGIDISNVKDMHRIMMQHNVFLMHKGDFSQGTILPILKMIEGNVEGNSGSGSMKKIVYHMLIEVLQNVCKHSLDINGLREGVFMMGKEGEHYSISAGNYIANDKVEVFKGQIEMILSLTPLERDLLYKKILREGKVTETGGAGLGLIDLSRESADPIEYLFEPVDGDKTFFTLRIVVWC